MPKNYRKKPVVIEALKTYWGQPMTELREFVKGKLQIYGDGVVFKDAIEGTLKVSPGDYIIKYECGRITTCSADEFKAAYDEVTSNVGKLTVNVNYPNIEVGVKRTIEEMFKKLNKAVELDSSKEIAKMNEVGYIEVNGVKFATAEAEPLLKVGVGFNDSFDKQFETVLHVVADRVAKECQDTDQLHGEKRLHELSDLINAYSNLYSKSF